MTPNPNDPVVRYRIELLTDKALCWFAQVECHTAAGCSTEFTPRHETWEAAMKSAVERIKEKRK